MTPLVLADALERMTDAFVALDRDWRYLYVNARAGELLGRDPRALVGKHIWTEFPDAVGQPFHRACEQAMETQQPVFVEEHVVAWGRWLENRCYPSPDGLTVFFTDTTERRRSDAALREAQRLEAVGRLAGGVAHDFNNLLAVVLSFADLAIGALPEDHPARADVGEIRRAAERGAALTRQLLAFGRKQLLQPRPVELDAALAEAERTLRRALPPGVILRVIPSPARIHAKVDPGQLQQAIVNLVVNARDALPEGGVVEVEPAVRELEAGHPSGAAPGSYAVISVRDGGAGMDAATLARACEPFFSTKPPGLGTGLGLPMVHGFAAQSGGAIWLESAPGTGTVATLFLPLASPEPARAAAARPAPRPARAAPATVLVVEDEASVRGSIARILERQGYRVVQARHGADALLAWDTAGGAVDVVVTDLVMPEMGGRALVEQLRQRKPDLPVVVVSGYEGEGSTGGAPPMAGVRLLEKPFDASALVRAVDEALATGEGR